MAKLVIYEELDGEETIFENFDLTVHRILIGSSEDNNLVLDIPEIDPQHASLEFRNDHWVIQDLGGPGGTMVNGLQVNGPHRLNHDDLIELQTIRIKFHDEVVIDDSDDTTAFLLADPPNSRKTEKTVSGRVWFGTVTGITLAIIFAIVLGFVVLDVLNVINIVDLLPFGLGS